MIVGHIDEVISPAIAELVFAAVQEALRNTARGSYVHRLLRLTFEAKCNPRSYSAFVSGCQLKLL